MRGKNNLKRRTKSSNRIKNNTRNKIRKFKKFKKIIYDNSIKTVFLNTPIVYKKSNKYSNEKKHSRGFSITEINTFYKKFNFKKQFLLNYDKRRKKISKLSLKFNLKKLHMIYFKNSMINDFKN